MEPPLFKRLINIYSRFERLLVEGALWIIFRPERFLKSSIPGYHIFLAKGRFYKVSLRNRQFLEMERANLISIREKFSGCAPMVPEYSFRTIFFGKILIQEGEILEPVTSAKEQYLYARRVLTLLREQGVKRHCNLEELPGIQKGLDLMEGILDRDSFRSLRQKACGILQSGMFFMGPCHGDFHSRNFMRRNGFDFMIDFDCFRSGSIQEFDGIYFLVHRLIDDIPGIWWLEAMELLQERRSFDTVGTDLMNEIYGSGDRFELLLLYFLDRLAQDATYGPIAERRAREVAMGFFKDRMLT